MTSLTFLDATFQQYLPWIIVGGVLVVAGIVVLIVLYGRGKKKKRKPKPRPISKSAYFEALGGEGNLIEHIRKGSRIELKLRDYEAIDKEKLKEAGVDGFIKMSDRLTLVIKGDASAVEKTLFGSSDD